MNIQCEFFKKTQLNLFPKGKPNKANTNLSVMPLEQHWCYKQKVEDRRPSKGELDHSVTGIEKL